MRGAEYYTEMKRELEACLTAKLSPEARQEIERAIRSYERRIRECQEQAERARLAMLN